MLTTNSKSTLIRSLPTPISKSEQAKNKVVQFDNIVELQLTIYI
jgi:hypothetical protein